MKKILKLFIIFILIIIINIKLLLNQIKKFHNLISKDFIIKKVNKKAIVENIKVCVCTLAKLENRYTILEDIKCYPKFISEHKI